MLVIPIFNRVIYKVWTFLGWEPCVCWKHGVQLKTHGEELTKGKIWMHFQVSPCVFLCLFWPMRHLTLGRTIKENRLHGLKGFVEGTSRLDQEALKWLQNRLMFFFNPKKVVIFECQENIYKIFRFIQVLTKLEYMVVKVNLILVEFFQTTVTTYINSWLFQIIGMYYKKF